MTDSSKSHHGDRSKRGYCVSIIMPQHYKDLYMLYLGVGKRENMCMNILQKCQTWDLGDDELKS